MAWVEHVVRIDVDEQHVGEVIRLLAALLQALVLNKEKNEYH